jgi:hypothetical protein
MIDSLASVVIDDFHVVGVTVDPSKADTPLIVDPDAVLAFAIPFEGCEPIGRRNAQIIQHGSVAKHAQFAARHGLDIGGQVPGWRSAADLFRFLVGKVPDHSPTITQAVI